MKATTILAAYCDAVNQIHMWQGRMRWADNPKQREAARRVKQRRMDVAEACYARLERICQEHDDLTPQAREPLRCLNECCPRGNPPLIAFRASVTWLEETEGGRRSRVSVDFCSIPCLDAYVTEYLGAEWAGRHARVLMSLEGGKP